MKGIPGSGKSTMANFIAQLFSRASSNFDVSSSGEPSPEAIVCSADNFFMKDGVYKFDKSKIWLAHKSCQARFKAALEGSHPFVIVDNTNLTKKETDFYEEEFKKHGYLYSFVIMPVPTVEESVSRNAHNVPKETIEGMVAKIQGYPYSNGK